EQHHRPAAAEAVDPLTDAHVEHASPLLRPMAEKVGQRPAAFGKAGMLERGELIEAGGDEERRCKAAVGHWTYEALDRCRNAGEGKPYCGIAACQHQWRNDWDRLRPGRFGDIEIDGEHRCSL